MKTPLTLFAATSVTLITSIACAGDAGDIRLLADADITLVQAIEAAIASEGGQALEAQIDDDSFEPRFEVTLVRDGRVYDVYVNAADGSIVGVRENMDD